MWLQEPPFALVLGIVQHHLTQPRVHHVQEFLRSLQNIGKPKQVLQVLCREKGNTSNGLFTFSKFWYGFLNYSETEDIKKSSLLFNSNGWLPWSPEVFNSLRQILTLLNKVRGYWLKGETDLANKPRNMQIFPLSKFGIDRTAGLKVMAKKFLRPKLYFSAITFEAAVRLIPNFECEKICMFLGMFAKSVSPWSQ